MGGGDIASLGFRPWALAPSPSQPGLGLEPGTFPVESIRRGPTLLGPEERSWGFSIRLSGHELPGLGPDRGGGLREALLTVCCSSCIPLPAHRGPFPSWQAAPAAALAPAPAKPADAPPARRVSVRGLLWECGVWAECEQGAQSSAGRSRTVTKLPGNPYHHPHPPTPTPPPPLHPPASPGRDSQSELESPSRRPRPRRALENRETEAQTGH